ncbi:FtsX-like permease family protein [Acinetobacter sp.]|uniref:ABC transporter permease n=1 Tax=Acinetobacter sp. TaxID=472 RepID=UPI0031E419A0
MNTLFKPLLQQSLRNQSLWLLMIALSLAICATTALKFSNGQIQQAVRLQAAQMLAADLALTDQNPIQSQYVKQAQQLQLRQSQVMVFGTMARTDNQFVMVTVKAVDQHYPLRGKLQISSHQAQIKQGQVWLSPRAQELLKVKLGDEVSIADAKLKFTGMIQRDLNQEMGFSGFSPTVIISNQDIAQTHAVQTGSRIEYRLLLSGTSTQIQNYQQWFQQHHAQLQHEAQNQVTGNLLLRDARQGNSRLLRPLRNLDLFLQLSNLITVLLCGIAIALASRRYVQQSQDQMALLRCLGASQRQILTMVMLLMLSIMIISAVVGCIVGLGIGGLLLQIMLQFIPNLDLSLLGFESLLPSLGIALLTSSCVLFGFMAPNIYQLFKIPPIRVIRPESVAQGRYVWTAITGIFSLAVLSFILTGNLSLTLGLLVAILLIGVVFFSLLWLFLKWLKQQKNRFSVYARMPAQMASYITVLALGVSLMSVLLVLKTDLFNRWQQQLPANTPNQFVYGLPPMDKPAFEKQLSRNGWSHTPLYPNIRARLIAKNGQAFSNELIQQNNSLRRELNLTQSAVYPSDNRVVQGTAQLEKAGEVSVEEKTAQALGIQLGDQLTFQLPEGNLNAKVVNFRKVTWESFSPNFFFIFAPKTLDENAGSYLGSFYVPPQDKTELIDLIQNNSTTVFIDISNILEQVKALLGILVKVITILATLVAISGFLVLVACLNLLMDERRYEVALLRAFGSSQQQVKRMFSLEFGFIGACAGIIACIFAEVISAIAGYKLGLNMQFHLNLWLILPTSMTLMCILIARYCFRHIYQVSPLLALRE